MRPPLAIPSFPARLRAKQGKESKSDRQRDGKGLELHELSPDHANLLVHLRRAEIDGTAGHLEIPEAVWMGYSGVGCGLPLDPEEFVQGLGLQGLTFADYARDTGDVHCVSGDIVALQS